jgi:hypothetical protein
VAALTAKKAGKFAKVGKRATDRLADRVEEAAEEAELKAEKAIRGAE